MYDSLEFQIRNVKVRTGMVSWALIHGVHDIKEFNTYINPTGCTSPWVYELYFWTSLDSVSGALRTKHEYCFLNCFKATGWQPESCFYSYRLWCMFIHDLNELKHHCSKQHNRRYGDMYVPLVSHVVKFERKQIDIVGTFTISSTIVCKAPIYL